MTQAILPRVLWLVVCTAWILAGLGCTETPSVSRVTLQDEIDLASTQAMPSVVMIEADDGLGTGFLVSHNLVVTNHHVIEGSEEEAIAVLLHDGRVTTARVVHHEKHPDIAVLKLEEEFDNMPHPLRFADMRNARPGLLVLSIGHPGGLENSISLGIISAVGRPGSHLHEYFLQTDAAINSGNSGGPLVNLQGEVVGISTAKLQSVGGYSLDGVSFALSGNIVDRIIKDLQRQGKVVRPDLGLEALTEVTGPKAIEQGVPHGALRLSLKQEGSATEAGLRDGDILTAIDGEKVRGIHSFWVRLHRRELGEQVKLSIAREGVLLEVTLPLTINLGVEFSSNLQVKSMRLDSPLIDSGLRPGDIVVAVGVNDSTSSITNLNELKQAVQQSFRRAPLRMIIKREDRTISLGPIYLASHAGQEQRNK